MCLGQIKLADDLDDGNTPRAFFLDREDLKLRPLPASRKNEDFLTVDAVRDQLKLVCGYLRRAVVSLHEHTLTCPLLNTSFCVFVFNIVLWLSYIKYKYCLMSDNLMTSFIFTK